MKRLLLLAIAIVILLPVYSSAIPFYDWQFNLPGYDSHVYDYADVVSLQGTSIGFLQSCNWTHALPENFNAIKSNVTDAQLWISATGVTSDNSTMATIEGLGRWEYLEGQDWHWSWRWGIVFDDQSSETVIGLPTTMEDYSFWMNDPINVCVGTGQLFTSINMTQSVLMMDYEGNDAVPEPATIALFGLGLAGVGFVRRKFRK